MAPSERTPRPPVALIADDHEWSARSLESILSSNGYAVIRVASATQALELTRRARPDAIFASATLPDIGGTGLCQMISDDLRLPATLPLFVIATNASERAARAAAHAAGAWEYCSQPLDVEMLLLKLSVYVRAKRDAERRLGEGLLDEETGLYSVRGLALRTREIGADVQRRRAPLACIAVSPNGEGTAPDIITHLADVLRRHARISDVVGRLGESEFGIIAPATGADGAARLIERLRAAYVDRSADRGAQATPPRALRVACSVVPNFAESPVDAAELLLRASSALRQSGPVEGVRLVEPVPIRV